MKDAATGEAVGDAYVEVIAENGKSTILISGQEGQITLPEALDVKMITVQHLNYRFFRSTSVAPCGSELQLEPDVRNLEEVVLTGQHRPQSLQRSVLRIQSLDRKEIVQSGTRAMSDVLLYQEGVQIDRDPAIGAKSLRLAGADGNNVKVLIDGVPVSGRVGFTFDIDQLDLLNVERIEIVEGPMSVEYGSQALAGVVNLITRKPVGQGVNLEANIHEETTGSSYGLDEGTHNYGLSGSAKITDGLGISAGLSRKYFGGAQIALSGRAREWDPRTQYQGFVLLNARPGDWRLNYRIEGLDENIENLGAPAGIDPPIAIDDSYQTQRLMQQLHFGSMLKGIGLLDGHISYTYYNRVKNSFATNLQTGTSQLVSSESSQDSTRLHSFNGRWQLGKLLADNLSIQAGGDVVFERARGGRIEGNNFRQFVDLGIYLTGEWKLHTAFTLRPALRYSYHSLYPAPLTPSLHLLYALNEDVQIRMGFGKGFRAPDLRELYFNFFDATHQIVGNPDLEAERSDFFDFSISKTKFNNNSSLKMELRSYYQDIRDRIDFVQSAENPNLTTLNNIARLETSSVLLSGKYVKEGFSMKLCGSMLGSGAQVASPDRATKWSWTPVVQTGIGYDIPGSEVHLQLNYRWQGESPVFRYSENEDQILRLSQESYQFADFIINWQAMDAVNLSFGLRNLFNVKSIQTAGAGGGVHSGGEQQFLGYGRSVFLGINYQYNKKQKE